MPVAMPARLKEVSQHKGPEDFKQKVREVVKKSLPGFKPLGTDVLLATYVQSEVTAGGIIRPDQTSREDVWQGRAGVILALGPSAFKYAQGGYAWEGEKPKVGDFVVFRFADAFDLFFEGLPCRLVDSENVRAVVDDPETVYANRRSASR